SKTASARAARSYCPRAGTRLGCMPAPRAFSRPLSRHAACSRSQATRWSVHAASHASTLAWPGAVQPPAALRAKPAPAARSTRKLAALSLHFCDPRPAGLRLPGGVSIAVEVPCQQPDSLGDLFLHGLLADAQPGRDLLLRQFLDPAQPH